METNALSALALILDGLSIPWVLIGAVAANRYRASPRLTHDVDILIDTITPTTLAELELALRNAGWAVRRADPEGALMRLRHTSLGVADLLVAGTDYQANSIARARRESLAGGVVIRILLVEDVIVHKLIAGRAQDLADIEAILATAEPLDRAYVERWAAFWDVTDRWLALTATK